MLTACPPTLECFASHAAHDLRAPIGNIAVLARMSADALARGDQGFVANALPAMAAQADDAVELLLALLMLAQGGDAPLPLAPVAAASVVHAALNALPDPAARSAARLVIGPLPEVQAHAGLLRQVFVNLLANALKFTQARRPAVVTVGAMTGPFEHVFRVCDNGIGFDQKAADRLFRPFQRLHGAAYPGHGLGLSIACRIVVRHGGRIWCRSQPGRGTTMLFTLPRRPPCGA